MDSTLTQPDAASLMARCWHWWQVEGQSSVQDFRKAVTYQSDGGQPTPNELQVRVSEFKALVKRAQDGKLRSDQWDPVVRNPLLWELRWMWGSLQARAYFHEPIGRFGNESVVAHIHIKQIVHQGTDADRATRAAQDREMDLAGQRIDSGAAENWGLPASDPIVNQRHS